MTALFAPKAPRCLKRLSGTRGCWSSSRINRQPADLAAWASTEQLIDPPAPSIQCPLRAVMALQAALILCRLRWELGRLGDKRDLPTIASVHRVDLVASVGLAHRFDFSGSPRFSFISNPGAGGANRRNRSPASAARSGFSPDPSGQEGGSPSFARGVALTDALEGCEFESRPLRGGAAGKVKV
jgi:hypothetical protein